MRLGEAPTVPKGDILFPRPFILRERRLEGGPAAEIVQAFAGNRLRSMDEKGSGILVDFAARELYEIDGAAHTYRRTTFDRLLTVKALAASRFAALPERERTEVESFLAAFRDIHIEDAREESTIAGVRVHRYRLAIGPRSDDVWAAPALRLPAAYYEAQALIYADAGPVAEVGMRVMEAMAKNGYPMRTVSTIRRTGDADPIRSVVEVADVRFGAAAEAAVKLPANFKEIRDTGRSPAAASPTPVTAD